MLSTEIVQSPNLKEIQTHRNNRPTDMNDNLEAKQTVNINNILSSEILYVIFRQLIPLVTIPHPVYKPKDWLPLKTTREVCHLWRDLAEAPRLWQKMRLQVTLKNLSAMPGLLLKAVVVNRGLREMTFSFSDLFSVDP